MNNTYRVYIISGHYGSGKTETALNLAFTLRCMTEEAVTIADLDIINPYFRSRERKDLLESKGIHLIGGSINDSQTGVPALSAEVQAKLNRPEGVLLLDTGGDPEGITLLGRYREELTRLREEDGLDHYFVYNPYRPETSTPKKGADMLRMIEDRSGTTVDGLICNGHFLKNTTQENIREAWRLTEELSGLTGIPVAFCQIPFWVTPPEEIPYEKRIIIDLHMRSDWMS